MIAASMSPEVTESTRGIEILAWVEVNKKRLAIGAVVVAVIAAAIALLGWRSRQGERDASAALLQLETLSGVPGAAEPSASALQQVARDHSGTRAAARARLLAAESLFQGGNYAESKAEFQAAAGLLSDDSLVAAANYGVAASMEALGQTNEALAAYRDLTVRHSTAAAATQARLAMAGLYEQSGELAQAMALYGELTNLVNSPWSSEAKTRIDSLLVAHPELAPTPKLAVAAESGALTNPPANTPATVEPGSAPSQPVAEPKDL